MAGSVSVSEIAREIHVIAAEAIQDIRDHLKLNEKEAQRR